MGGGLCSFEDVQLNYLDLFLIHWPMIIASGKDVFDHVPISFEIQYASQDRSH